MSTVSRRRELSQKRWTPADIAEYYQEPSAIHTQARALYRQVKEPYDFYLRYGESAEKLVLTGIQWTMVGAARERSSRDEQSGSAVLRQPEIAAAEQAIRSAYDRLQPDDALRTISEIWEQLDRTSELAAARSRILMGKMEKPRLAELPGWFQDQKPRLFDEEESVLVANPVAVETAELLVRALLAAIDEAGDLQAEVETGPLGRVIVDWHLPGSRLQWMVEAVDLPWPCVKVYQLSHRTAGNTEAAAQTRIFHSAFGVVESSVEFIHGT